MHSANCRQTLLPPLSAFSARPCWSPRREAVYHIYKNRMQGQALTCTRTSAKPPLFLRLQAFSADVKSESFEHDI